MRPISSLTGFAAFVLIAGPVSAQVTVGAIPPADVEPTEVAQEWGTRVQVFGQTFVTPDPANTRLDMFGFMFGPTPSSYGTSHTYSFTAAIYEWNGLTPVIGGPLWSGTATRTTGDPQEYEFFHTGGLYLNPTSIYVAMLDAGPDYGGPYWPELDYDMEHLAVLSAHFADQAPYMYDGGHLLMSTPFERGDPTTLSYTQYYDYDAVFEGVYNTPEPATLLLLATGLAAMAGVGAIRRKKGQGEA